MQTSQTLSAREIKERYSKKYVRVKRLHYDKKNRETGEWEAMYELLDFKDHKCEGYNLPKKCILDQTIDNI